MSGGERRTLIVGALLLAGLGAFVGARMEVVTDVTHFLPEGEDRDLAQLSRRIADSELSRTMVLLVGGPDKEVAVEASRRFEANLRADPRVAEHLSFLEGGPPEGVDRALWDLYHPRRLSFVAEDPEAARARTTDAGLREAARDLKRRLALPTSTLVSRLAPSDPFLALPDLFDRLEASRGGDVRLAGDRFVTADGGGAVLFLGTEASAFDTAVQGPLLQGIRDAFAEMEESLDAELTLGQSGINRFAVRAEEAIKADIQRVGVLSIAGLLVLFLVLFRSLRVVALTALPIGAGMLTACAVSLALFGRIHGLTLAFGAALIGVCIDYAVHFYCHHVLAPEPGGPRHTLRHIWFGLLLGAATTIVGFAALVASSFPGLQEVAVFASVGIAAALAATRWLLPPLMPRTTAATPAARGLAHGLGRLLDAMGRRRRALWLLPIGAAIVTALALPQVRWDDDMASLNRLDPELLAEDEAVRNQVARFEQRRFVLALGDTEEEALQVHDRVVEELKAAVEIEELGGYRGLGELLPSARRQERVAAAVRESPDLWERFAEAFEEEGFRPEAFEPFREHLEAEPPPPLRFEDLVDSPLAPMVRSFRIGLDDRVGILDFLRDVEDREALAARFDGVDGALFLDQASLMAETQRAYRSRTVQLLLLGLVAVLVLVALRYRRPRPTAAAFLPAILAGGVTIAALTAADVPMNLLALTALLMVLSMGVDYGVFLAEAASGEAKGLAATLTALVVACASTVLGFGLLALSEHPALRTIGLTAGVGVVASLLLAPTTLVLLKREERP